MRLKMKENSLFAVLLRSPWWVSFLVAAVIGVVATLAVPVQYRTFAFLSGAPFFIVGCIAVGRQWRAPSPRKTFATLYLASEMPASVFTETLAQGFRRQGYTVKTYSGQDADLEAEKSGRVALIACTRWKAAQLGMGQLKKLRAAATRHGAQDCIFITTAEVSDSARRFAEASKIDIVTGVRLAALLDCGPRR